MRKSLFYGTLLLGFFMMNGQSVGHDITEGDILILGPPSGVTYKAIKFPKKNTIIKRGAIANFNLLIGERVFVAQIESDKKGRTIVTLKRKNGMNFFRFFPKVKADLSSAIKSKELKTVNENG